MFSRILVPLDGSPRAEMILPQLGRILRHEDAEILLLRVVDVPTPVPAEWAATVVEMRRREREESQKYLHNLSRRFAGRGAKVHARILAGLMARAMASSRAVTEPAWNWMPVATRAVKAASLASISVSARPLGDGRVAP